MDKFDLAELSGRDLFKTILDLCQILDYLESVDKYDSLDLYFSYKDLKAGVEIKKRDKLFESYPTYLMELYKYLALSQRLNKELDSIYYANFFGDDTLYLFSLKVISRALKEGRIEITTTLANRTTSIYSGKVEKLVLLLPKELALKLVKVGDKWINPNKISLL